MPKNKIDKFTDLVIESLQKNKKLIGTVNIIYSENNLETLSIVLKNKKEFYMDIRI